MFFLRFHAALEYSVASLPPRATPLLVAVERIISKPFPPVSLSCVLSADSPLSKFHPTRVGREYLIRLFSAFFLCPLGLRTHSLPTLRKEIGGSALNNKRQATLLSTTTHLSQGGHPSVEAQLKHLQFLMGLSLLGLEKWGNAAILYLSCLASVKQANSQPSPSQCPGWLLSRTESSPSLPGGACLEADC